LASSRSMLLRSPLGQDVVVAEVLGHALGELVAEVAGELGRPRPPGRPSARAGPWCTRFDDHAPERAWRAALRLAPEVDRLVDRLALGRCDEQEHRLRVAEHLVHLPRARSFEAGRSFPRLRGRNTEEVPGAGPRRVTRWSTRRRPCPVAGGPSRAPPGPWGAGRPAGHGPRRTASGGRGASRKVERVGATAGVVGARVGRSRGRDRARRAWRIAVVLLRARPRRSRAAGRCGCRARSSARLFSSGASCSITSSNVRLGVEHHRPQLALHRQAGGLEELGVDQTRLVAQLLEPERNWRSPPGRGSMVTTATFLCPRRPTPHGDRRGGSSSCPTPPGPAAECTRALPSSASATFHTAPPPAAARAAHTASRPRVGLEQERAAAPGGVAGALLEARDLLALAAGAAPQGCADRARRRAPAGPRRGGGPRPLSAGPPQGPPPSRAL